MLSDNPIIPLPVVCKMESTEQVNSLSSQKNDKKVFNGKQRSSNFNLNETLKLEELVKQNFEIINCKLTNQITNNKKCEIWKEISQQVSSLGYAARSDKQCMEKWANMKRKAKEDVTKERVERRKTGGGSLIEASQQSCRIQEMFSSSASFNGIDGGLDTDEPDGLHFISNSSKDAEQNKDQDVTSNAFHVTDGDCEQTVMQPSTKTMSTGIKRPSSNTLSSTIKKHRSRQDVLMDYQIQYFKGMVERQGLERELMEVKLRILKSAESKLDELDARELLKIISEQ